MLDENLPTFFLKPSPDGLKHHRAFVLSQRGADPEAAYSLHHLDPVSQVSKNRYAAALFDAYNPDVLFGEILVIPEWSQPTLSQEEIRKNGGLPLPPQMILPSQFTIQLYEPDQQVVVTQKPGSWGGSSSYEFSMPQTTFRTPSASALDRGRSDPVATATTPRLNFVWRREGKLTKDFTCFLTGKSTDVGKKKSKEPDIAVALFRSLREVTIYEPNLSRVEMEDLKGLEIVLLLGAAAIKDIYYNQAKDTFNILDPPRKDSGSYANGPTVAPQRTSPPQSVTSYRPPPVTGPGRNQKPHVAPHGTASRPSTHPSAYSTENDMRRHEVNPIRTANNQRPQAPMDPRARWEIETETARLKAQAEAERREQRRIEEASRREHQKREEVDRRQAQKLAEREKKEQRRRQAEVEKETERLRKKYGTQADMRPQQPSRHQHQPYPQQHVHWQQPSQYQQRRHSAAVLQSVPQQLRPQTPSRFPSPRPQHHHHNYYPQQSSHNLTVPHRQPGVSASGFFGGGGVVTQDPGKTLKVPKKSFWGLRSKSEGSDPRLRSKRSSIF